MNKIFLLGAFMKNILVALFILCFSFQANAGLIYTFAGSWFVDDGPSWTTNPDIYTGQEAAALLFGGSASDYAISTVSDQVGDINFKTWLDGWGDSFTYGFSGNPADHDFEVDIDGGGYNSPANVGNSYSAYVMDHSLHLENFAFRISDDNMGIPEPATNLILILSGILLIASRKKANIK